jgi:hypothetical protein
MTTPGASIILDTNDRIALGVYADTFRPSEGVLVYKLFIGFLHHPTVSQGITDPEDDHRRRKTCDSNAGLTRSLRRTHSSATTFPIRFGAAKLPTSSITTKASPPTTCSPAAMAWNIEGEAAKLTAVDQLAHIMEAQSAFHRVGIAHTTARSSLPKTRRNSSSSTSPWRCFLRRMRIAFGTHSQLS